MMLNSRIRHRVAGTVFCVLLANASPLWAGLPSEYQQVEYIQSVGGGNSGQRIDTDYIHKSTTKVVCEVLLEGANLEADYSAIFGARNNDYMANGFSFFIRFGKKTVPVFCRTGAETQGSNFVLDEKVTLTCEGLTAKWVGAVTGASGSIASAGSNDDGANRLVIFNLNTGAADAIKPDMAYVPMKLYSFKIYEGDQLVRNFVPCYKKGDAAAIGLYDVVLGNFFENQGAGAFVKGEDVGDVLPDKEHCRIEVCGAPLAPSGVEPDYGVHDYDAGDGTITLTAPQVAAGARELLGYELQALDESYNDPVPPVTNAENSVTLPLTGGTATRVTWLWAKSTAGFLLPSEYQRVEYIQSVGGGDNGQRIDTDYVHKPTTKIVCEALLEGAELKSSWGAIFGARNVNYMANAFSFFIRFNGKTVPLFCRTGVETQGSNFVLDEKVTLTCEGLAAEWVGAVTGASGSILASAGSNDNGANRMVIFNLNTGAAGAIEPDVAYVPMKLYSFKIYEGDLLVRNFVPCYKKGDASAVGLYDVVLGNFFENQGTGAFVKGEDVVNVLPDEKHFRLEVCGAPLAPSGVDPDYGVHDYDAGDDTITLTAPQVADGAWELLGYELQTLGESYSDPVPPVTNAENSVTLPLTGGTATRVTWLWAKSTVVLALPSDSRVSFDLDPKMPEGGYTRGTDVRVTASCANGWQFFRWKEGCVPAQRRQDNPLTLTMDDNLTLGVELHRIVPADAFSHSADLTVAGYRGEGSLTDFPLLVRVSPVKIAGFDYAQCRPDGKDVVFSMPGVGVLPSEIDTWNPSGESLVWVKVPQVSGRDTQLRIHWGADAVATSADDVSELWDDYLAVWHFSEDSGAASDSSPLGTTGVLADPRYVERTVGVEGMVGRARHIAGTSNGSSLKTANSIVFPSENDFTLSTWYKFEKSMDGNDYGIFWNKPGTGWSNSKGWIASIRRENISTGKRGDFYVCGQRDRQWNAASTADILSGWHYLTLIVNGGVLSAACDGEMLETSRLFGDAETLDILATSDPGVFGYSAECEMDETRIRRNGNVSQDWVAAEYAQMTNADFVVFSEAASAVGVPVLADAEVEAICSGRARVSVDVTDLGEGADEADVQVALRLSDDETPEYRSLGRVTAAGRASFEVDGIKPGSIYSVLVRIVNSLGKRAVATVSLETEVNLRGQRPRWYSEVTPTGFVSDKDWAHESLVDFPLMVRISPERIAGFSYSDCPDGKGLVFVNTAGDPLPFEIDTWNPANESIVWVKVPRLEAGTKIFMMWGTTGGREATSGENPSAVWSDYVGVWHLNETEGNALDSTGNGHTAEVNADYANVVVATNDAKIGMARNIVQINSAHGQGQIVDSPLKAAGCTVADPENFAIQCWYKFRSFEFNWNNSDPGMIYVKNPSDWSAKDGWFVSAHQHNFPAKYLYLCADGSAQVTWTNELQPDSWCHYSVSVNGAMACLYENGMRMNIYNSSNEAGIPFDTASASVHNPTYPVLFGCNVNCLMDEIRIRNKPISRAWAYQEYQSMTSPDYLSFTPAKSVPRQGIVIFLQ